MTKTTVKATCPNCGDIATDIEKFVLRLPEGILEGTGEYRFTCPKCEKIVLKTASSIIVKLLSTAGAHVEFYSFPLEVMERPLEGKGNIISLDDIIDLHFDLEKNEEAWLRKMDSNGE